MPTGRGLEHQDLATLQLATDHQLTGGIHSVELKDRLGDVETDCRDRLHGWLPKSREPQLLPQPWHSRAGGGAVHSIKFGSGRLSSYQLIGTQQERFRDRQAESLCGLEVDD